MIELKRYEPDYEVDCPADVDVFMSEYKHDKYVHVTDLVDFLERGLSKSDVEKLILKLKFQ